MCNNIVKHCSISVKDIFLFNIEYNIPIMSIYIVDMGIYLYF